MNAVKAASDAAASVAKSCVPQMLTNVEQDIGLLPASAMAEAVIRAAAIWIEMFVGPRTAYSVLQEMADEVGLRLANRMGAK